MTLERVVEGTQPIQMGRGLIKGPKLHDRRTGVQRGIRGWHKQDGLVVLDDRRHFAGTIGVAGRLEELAHRL